MFASDPCFVAWEERILCHDRGSRVVHFYLKEESGDTILAVIGAERSIRHMLYAVSDEFLHVYGTNTTCKKWRARREVVDWLTLLVSKHRRVSNSKMNKPEDALGSLRVMNTGFSTTETSIPDQMVSSTLQDQISEIEWSGAAWVCAKQLKHYPAFCRNGTTISVHSFVFILAKEGSNYIGYLEDMYEDKKGRKKVKVRWFDCNHEVKGISGLNSHPREVFITPCLQVISAECVDGTATVLSPEHYEKFLEALSHLSSRVHMCFRQLKNNTVKPFTISTLRGYSNQAILSQVNCHKLIREDEEEFTHNDPVRTSTERNIGCKECQELETGCRAITEGHIMKCEPTFPKVTIWIPRKVIGFPLVGTRPRQRISLMIDDKIELLCQDSGLRGCWFRCTALAGSPNKLKVKYDDVQDVDGRGNLEEWVLAPTIAEPDILGMRSSGRLTIRPRAPKDSSDCSFEVGAAVDAWWSDGWWEGVVTGVNLSGNDSLQVYLPGENKFLTVQRKNVRTSRDWEHGKWLDIKADPDILSYLTDTAIPSTVEAIRCDGVSQIVTVTTSELDIFAQFNEESSGSVGSEFLQTVKGKGVNPRKRPCNDNVSDAPENEFQFKLFGQKPRN